MNINRVAKVLLEMKKNNLKQMLISSPASIFYLTGKWFCPGERMVVLLIKNNGDHKLIVNRLFPVNEDLGIDIVWYEDKNDPTEILRRYIDNNAILGIDKDWPSRFLISLISKNAAKQYVNSSFIIDKIRSIKDDEERELMIIASKKNDKVMTELWKEFKEGRTEKYYVNVLRELYENQGMSEFSFEPIVAFNPNGADPHHGTDNTVLKKGDSIVIDIGGVYKSYCSDMTRTVFFGKEPEKEEAKIYNIVKNSNINAINSIKEGVRFSDIDKIAREYIKNYGYGEYFTHRTGHSIGIETHDFGDVSENNNDEVKEGMIFSVEPGIYLPNKFGVRIEDLVMVTKDGARILNSVSKEITVV